MLSHRMKTTLAALALVFAVLLQTPTLLAQTFRGTLTGIVVDSQGAVIGNAVVTLKNPATEAVQNGKSNGSGEFSFPELQPGIYQVTVAVPGFETAKIDNIDVAISKVTTVKAELKIGAESTVVDVQADAIQTDTTSSALVSVIDSKSVQEMPMNGRNFTQMVKYAPGVGALSNSVNGSRTSSINYQVDGADNVDAWLGIVASNQGGIASVAGGLIPIEAIDQFSMQAAGEADQGRNAGANSNMVLRSGTNHIHGDVFYFDRNEFFAAISPVAAVGSRKTLIRNHQGGFTLGGPIVKDKTFLFTAGEIQVAKANVALTDFVINNAYVTAATAFIKNYNQTPNPISINLYNLLFPADSKNGPATTNNYFASGASNYNSFNGIIKLDQTFSDKQKLSIRYLGTTGKQTAPTGSDYAQYFQTAPMHIHNFSIVHNYSFNSHISNQLTFGVNYFLQTFNDANQNFNPQANAGLNLGIAPGIVASGAPTINISGFDITGATQPSGRTDVTGHVTDNFHWTIGRHNLKIGGEFRHANINQLYFSSARGTFNFDGTRGTYFTTTTSTASPATKAACSTAGTGTSCAAACAASPTDCSAGGTANAQALAYCATLGFTTAATCNPVAYISDFLNGTPTNSSGAKLLQGNAQRVWTLNTEDAWVQDNFQATKKLNLTYGVRWTVPGVVTAAKNDVYSFVPTGNNTGNFQLGLYPNYYKAFAPRVGFSYAPFEDSRTVIRGSFGFFYDFPAMSSWVSGSTGNGGAAYTQNNPAGPDAAVIFIASNVTLATNVNPFVGANAPQVGAYGVNQNFKMPYAEVFSFGIEQQFSKSTLITVGYVGSEGRRLSTLFDINQPVANGTAVTVRPYTQTTAYGNENPTFVNGKPLAGINQLNFVASSNYNSLQASLRQTVWHGLSMTANYTWSKSMDDGSSPTTPMNSYNLHQDYGPSTFDGRNNLNGFITYNAPQLGHFMPRLTKGFQVNALYSFASGLPLNPLVSSDNSHTFQLKDRPDVRGNPYTGTFLSSSANTGRQYRYLSNAGSAAFATAAVGTYGNERRDAYYGPGFKTIDASLFKHTPITERVMSEFRAEIFNVANFNNFANPSVSNINSSAFGLITNTRNGAAAPGIGYGEPFNIQFALKLSF